MSERRYILRDQNVRDNCVKFVSTLPVSDKPLEVIVRPFKRKRRVEANSYYWFLLTHIAQEAYRLKISDDYHSPETWHEYFKQKFLGKRVIIDGDLRLIPQSSADKSVVEFMDYTAQVEVWAAEHNIIVPQQVSA